MPTRCRWRPGRYATPRGRSSWWRGRPGRLVPELVGGGRVDAAEPRLGWPWSRCSTRSRASTCSTSAPVPGIKTGQIAARMGDRGEMISVEIDPERAAEVAAQASASACAASPWSRPTPARRRWRRASTGSWSTHPARTWEPWPHAPMRAGASRRGRSSGWSRCRPGCWARPSRRCGPAASSSTRPARSPAARTRSGSRTARAAARGEVPRWRRGPRRPRSGAGLAARPTLPAAAPRPRSHHRILHLPPEKG